MKRAEIVDVEPLLEHPGWSLDESRSGLNARPPRAYAEGCDPITTRNAMNQEPRNERNQMVPAIALLIRYLQAAPVAG